MRVIPKQTRQALEEIIREASAPHVRRDTERLRRIEVYARMALSSLDNSDYFVV